ncbi:MAG: hypothetical protein WC456_02960 [Patescibacteria group bacterium]
MSNRNKIILIALGLALIVMLALLIWLGFSPSDITNQPTGGATAIEFMTDQEKDVLQVPRDLRAQVITREADGGIGVYKIISSDNEVVLDPAQVPPISPRQKNSLR